MNTFDGGGDKFFAVQDRVGKITDDFGVLAGGSRGGDVDIPGFDISPNFFGVHTKFGDGFFGAEEFDLVIFQDDLAAVGDDFEAIGAGRFAGGGDENAGSAVGIFEIGGDAVFDFDFMETPQLTKGRDGTRHAADPLQQVQLMGALIEQDAAAFALPGRPPGAGIIISLGAKPCGNDPVDAAEGTNFTGGNQPFKFFVNGLGALVEHSGEDLFFGLVSGDEFFAIGFVNGNRFFYKDVESGLQGGDTDGGMEIMRGSDQNGVGDFAFD